MAIRRSDPTRQLLVGGISIFIRMETGRRIGVIASYAYFLLLAIGLLFVVVNMFSSKFGMVGMRFFLWSLPRILFDAVAPTLLITLENRR